MDPKLRNDLISSAMHAFIYKDLTPEEVAKKAIEQADAVLKELNVNPEWPKGNIV